MRLLKHLLTYGKDADFDQINVAALAFSCDVYVYDIQTHQVQIISGQRPWDPQHTVVYDNYYMFPSKSHIYDTRKFGPITKTLAN